MDQITDPRIREIMAKLNKQESPKDAKEEQTKDAKQKPKTPRPPETFEEFLKVENLEEWPYRITSENLLELDEERELIGSKEALAAQLKEATPLDMKLLSDLEDQLTGFEERLKKYGNYLLNISDRDAEGDPGEGETPLPLSVSRTFMTEMDMDILKAHPGSRGRNKPLDYTEQVKETRKKNVEYCSFPGFRRGELTDLPGQLEAPQILNRVTKAQDFNPGFRKFWKKIFQSEASVAIMQDTFWWVFINNFEKDREEDQSHLFDRIADSFVALFTSVNPEIKDKVFTVYADCLAQSVYAAFKDAFPESDRHFQDNFKQHLVNLTSEWVSGIRPPQGSWHNWDLKRLEMKGSQTKAVTAAVSGTSNTLLNKEAKSSLDMDDFHRVLNRLGEEEHNPLATSVATMSAARAFGLSRDATKLSAQTSGTAMHGTGKVTIPVAVVPPISPSREALCGTPKKEPMESHQVGPGPELERIMFSIEGRSPLVSHYLHMRQLKDNRHRGKRVRRTQVSRQPPPAPTYKQLISETLSTQDTLSKEYQRICEVTNQEIQKIEKQQREANRRIEQLQKEIFFCKNSLEIKHMSEKILDKKEQEMGSRGTTRKGTSGTNTQGAFDTDTSN